MKDHLGSLGFSQIYLGKQGELLTSPSGEKPELRIIAIEVRENSSSYGLRIGLCGNQRRGLFLKTSQWTVKELVKAAEKEPSSGLEAGGDLDAACLVGVVVIEDECASQDSKRSGGNTTIRQEQTTLCKAQKWNWSVVAYSQDSSASEAEGGGF